MNFLFNPFKRYSEKVLLIIGVFFTLIGSYLAIVFKARFDGVLDFHFVSTVLPRQPLVDNLINIFCLTALLFAVGKYLNSGTRVIDILATVIVARIPYYLLPILNTNNMMTDVTKDLVQSVNAGQVEQIAPAELSILLLFTLIIILVLVWYIYLLYKGFKVAVNAKDTKATVLFFGMVLVAEVLSKFLIFHLN